MYVQSAVGGEGVGGVGGMHPHTAQGGMGGGGMQLVPYMIQTMIPMDGQMGQMGQMGGVGGIGAMQGGGQMGQGGVVYGHLPPQHGYNMHGAHSVPHSNQGPPANCIFQLQMISPQHTQHQQQVRHHGSGGAHMQSPLSPGVQSVQSMHGVPSFTTQPSQHQVSCQLMQLSTSGGMQGYGLHPLGSYPMMYAQQQAHPYDSGGPGHYKPSGTTITVIDDPALPSSSSSISYS